MSVRGTKKHSFLIFASLLALLASASVGWAAVGSPGWDPAGEHIQENAVYLQWTLPCLATRRAVSQQGLERIPAERLPRRVCPAWHPTASRGVPAEGGRDLLAFLQTCRT